MKLFKVKLLTCNISMDTPTQKRFLAPSLWLDIFSQLFRNKNYLGIYMYCVLHIVDREVRVRTHSTCIQLHILLLVYPFLMGMRVCLSSAGSNVAVLGILEDTGITQAFNSIFLLIAS